MADFLHGRFISGVELGGVDFGGWVEGREFLGVFVEVGGGEVAEIDCQGSIAGKLVGAGAADADF